MELDLVKEINDKMVSHQFVVSYMGNFNQDLLKSLINITEKRLRHIEEDKTVKNKIFHFMIECVQSICKVDDENELSSNFLFLIGKRGNEYVIHFGGLFSTSETNSLVTQINYVNSLNNEEIKEKYYIELKQKQTRKESLLLMSLLDISKRTKSKIDYTIKKINEQSNFLSFKTIISK
jgi:hypothetical protein